MKFYLPHQLMQYKSIFVQTGRATYITVMTMQSQGGTTNETKCNYCPTPPLEKQNKPPRSSLLGFQRAGGERPSPLSSLRASIGFPATI